MTPLQISILLHYYYSPDDVDNLHASSVAAALESFMWDGLLRKTVSDEYGRKYVLTTFGRTYVERLLHAAGRLLDEMCAVPEDK